MTGDDDDSMRDDWLMANFLMCGVKYGAIYKMSFRSLEEPHRRRGMISGRFTGKFWDVYFLDLARHVCLSSDQRASD